jgi:hypothetical protein
MKLTIINHLYILTLVKGLTLVFSFFLDIIPIQILNNSYTNCIYHYTLVSFYYLVNQTKF